jgi:aromatic ring-opening dioxygenase catalytic subunit (LigB family)
MKNDFRFPTLFIPHGGGPCFFMDPRPAHPTLWDKMAGYLRGIDGSLGVRPKAVLVISGHWETALPTVNTSLTHTLLFDYYGFPDDTYRLTYPAPGSAAVAARVRELLAENGTPSDEDAQRGLDHGVFVPFKLIYPNADVPIMQLSLQRDLDPETHLAMGRALAPLRDEGVLIVGSGMSFHNLRSFFVDDPRVNRPVEEFDEWLNDAVTASEGKDRGAKLTAWQEAPGAVASHPTPEHLLPLLVAAGAAEGDVATRTYSDRLMGKPISGFRFG